MKFKLEDYKDTQNITYAMHCKTVKEAESFCRFLDREGRKPKFSPDGEEKSYLKNKKMWFTYEENTVYYFNKDTIFDYRAIKKLHLQNVKVLEWSEYMEDLKPFRIGDYAKKGKKDFAMHCKTQKEAESFLKVLSKTGRKWVNGNLYSKYDNCWQVYKENTLYYFNKNLFGDLLGENENITVLEWSDFDADLILSYNEDRYRFLDVHDKNTLIRTKTKKEFDSLIYHLKKEGYFSRSLSNSDLEIQKSFNWEKNKKDTMFDLLCHGTFSYSECLASKDDSSLGEECYDWSNSCEYALEDNEEKVIFDLLKKTEALEVFALHNYPIDVESLFKMLETVAVMFYIKTKSFDCEGKDTIYDHINSDLFEIYKHIKTALAILGYGEIKINKLPKKYAQYKDCYKFCRDLMYSFPEQNNK